MQEKGHRIVERQRGRAVFKSKSGLESENIKKSTQSIFQEVQLKIIARYNLKIVDYLEVTLPYRFFVPSIQQNKYLNNQ